MVNAENIRQLFLRKATGCIHFPYQFHVISTEFGRANTVGPRRLDSVPLKPASPPDDRSDRSRAKADMVCYLIKRLALSAKIPDRFDLFSGKN